MENYYHVPSLRIFMNQLNYSTIETGILDSLLKQWNGFEDFNILNFNKILLKFATVFKFLKSSVLFWDHYCPTKL